MPKNKKWSLTEEEKVFLLGRKNVAKYISSMIENEMSKYVHDVVRKRIGVEETDNLEIDLEHGEIKLKPGKKEKAE